MSMIRIENLTFSYPSSYDAIFDHTSFQIDTDWKLGFWQKAIDRKYFTGSLPECRKLGIDA